MGGEKLRSCAGSWRKSGSPPRGRGKVSFFTMLVQARGSPPHGRGKESVFRHQCRQYRITPAWAGKSICLALPITAPRDHPRVGGEKSGRTQPEKLQPGSPPRGRGKASSGRTCAGAAGITPAWAGKRDGAAPTGSPPRDHPRVGGEKYLFPFFL